MKSGPLRADKPSLGFVGPWRFFVPKVNCWEWKKCGRQEGGAKTAELGVCPAASAERVNGANGGLNGGRACWALAGTLCGGKVQGTFATKISNCMGCDFYKLVVQEEGASLLGARAILGLMTLGVVADPTS